MTANEISVIDYRGTDLYAHDEFVAVRQMAEAMGIDWEAQRQLILRAPWSSGMTCITQAVLPGQTRAYPQFMLHRRRVPMWVANINAARIQDLAVRATVIRWQEEIADVLADFYEAKQLPGVALNVTGDAKVAAVLEAHAGQLHRVGFHPDGTVRYVEFRRGPGGGEES